MARPFQFVLVRHRSDRVISNTKSFVSILLPYSNGGCFLWKVLPANTSNNTHPRKKKKSDDIQTSKRIFNGQNNSNNTDKLLFICISSLFSNFFFFSWSLPFACVLLYRFRYIGTIQTENGRFFNRINKRGKKMNKSFLYRTSHRIPFHSKRFVN